MPVASSMEQRLWTRAEYHAADSAGVFGPDDRLELFEARIIPKVCPQSHPHAAAISITADLLREKLGRGYHVQDEKPIVLNDLSEPEPDIAVVQSRARDYRDHPTPEQIILLIGVSDSRLAYNLEDKAFTYAVAGIQEYWVLNLVKRQLEVLKNPRMVGDLLSESGYRERLILVDGEAVNMIALPEIVLKVCDMLHSNLSRPVVSI